MTHEIPRRPWESVGADILQLITNIVLTLYHRKFPIRKQVEGLSTQSLIKACENIIYSGGCKQFSIHHVVSSYNHQINGREEAWINFIRRTGKKCYKTNTHTHI